ncbi:MAG TPA: hypothetical protein ENF73_01645 [Proteobacteria bacterium]|nr:hypothetical protein [Pseudomonadota bacterium]
MSNKKLAVAAALFFISILIGQLGLHNRTLWYDEAVSILEGYFGPHGIWNAAKDEGIPPLYNIVLSLWMKISSSELWARELSVLFAALAVATFFLLASDAIELKRAVAASVLLAFIPLHLWQAQEIRMYAMVEFFAIASCLFFWRYLEHGGKTDLAAYALLSAPIPWLHYTAGLMFLAQAAFVAFNHRRYRNRMLGFALGIAAVGLLYLPWLPSAIDHVMLRSREFWTKPLTFERVWVIVGLFAGAPKIGLWTSKLAPWIFLIAFCAIAGTLLRSRERGLPFMCWLWFLVPLLIVILVSLKRDILLARTLIYILPPFLLLLAWTLDKIESEGVKRAFVIGLGVVALVSFASLRAYLFEPNWWAKSATRKSAKMIARFYKDGDIVIHSSRFSYRPFQYYLLDKGMKMCLIKETEQFPRLFELIGRSICPSDDESVKRIWYVGYADFQNPSFHRRAFEWYAQNHRFIEVSYFDDFFLIGLFERKSGQLVPPEGLWDADR